MTGWAPRGLQAAPELPPSTGDGHSPSPHPPTPASDDTADPGMLWGKRAGEGGIRTDARSSPLLDEAKLETTHCWEGEATKGRWCRSLQPSERPGEAPEPAPRPVTAALSAQG